MCVYSFYYSFGSYVLFLLFFFFFFNDTATTEIYTLSLHDALPICPQGVPPRSPGAGRGPDRRARRRRSEEHTSELQSHSDLVCRLLLEKKKKKTKRKNTTQPQNADPSTKHTRMTTHRDNNATSKHH